MAWKKLGEEYYPKLNETVDIQLKSGTVIEGAIYDEDDDGGFFIHDDYYYYPHEVELIKR